MKLLKIVLVVVISMACGVVCIRQIYSLRNKFVVGVILPLTGAVSDDGKAVLDGIMRARKQHPEIKDVEFVIEDGQYTSKATINAFNHLINTRNVKSLILYGVVPTEVLRPMLLKNKIPVYAVAVGEENFRNAEVPMRRVWFPIKRIGKIMGDYAMKKLQAHDAAILSIDNSYGIESAISFKNAFITCGGMVVSEEKFSMNESSLRNQVAKLLVMSQSLG